MTLFEFAVPLIALAVAAAGYAVLRAEVRAVDEKLEQRRKQQLRRK